jgi:hypothetical protein
MFHLSKILIGGFQEFILPNNPTHNFIKLLIRPKDPIPSLFRAQILQNLQKRIITPLTVARPLKALKLHRVNILILIIQHKKTLQDLHIPHIILKNHIMPIASFLQTPIRQSIALINTHLQSPIIPFL